MLNLKKLLTKLCEEVGVIGTVYTAAWTATSSVYGTYLTDGITVPPGTYVVILVVPLCSQSPTIAMAGKYFTPQTATTVSTVYQTSEQVTLRVMSVGSSNITYSYIDRGSLTAIRIA